MTMFFVHGYPEIWFFPRTIFLDNHRKNFFKNHRYGDFVLKLDCLVKVSTGHIYLIDFRSVKTEKPGGKL